MKPLVLSVVTLFRRNNKMGWHVETEKKLIWDNHAKNVQIVTNKGTVIAESGEVFCENAAEIFEATQALKHAMEQKMK
jgi:uncharacterized protein YeeX (DUF496 family)